MHLRHSCSSVLHHLAKTDWFMTLSFFVIKGDPIKCWCSKSFLIVIPIFPAFTIINFTVRILKPLFVALNFVFLCLAFRNGKELFQTVHISFFTVRSVIKFFPALIIIIFASWKVIELFEAFDIFFTVFTGKIESFSPAFFIIFLAGIITVILRKTIKTFFVITNLSYVRVYQPAIPIIPFAIWCHCFSFPTFQIVKLARHVHILFETLSILTITVSVGFYPTVVVFVLAVFRKSNCDFPTFNVIIFTVWKTKPCLPTSCIFITMRVKWIRLQTIFWHAPLLRAWIIRVKIFDWSYCVFFDLLVFLIIFTVFNFKLKSV